jgi:sulfhydrogenase subunit gamma (sulfur reductase)
MVENQLLPTKAEIIQIEEMTEIEKLIELKFTEDNFIKQFSYKPGQFVIIDVMGVGDAPFSLCNGGRIEADSIELCVRRVGRVTNALHRLDVGDTVGIRGPYGNGFPMEEFEGSNLLMIAGGLGIAPVRGVLNHAMERREEYGDLDLFYGIKCYDMMLFRDELLDLYRYGDEKEVNFYLSYEEEEDEICYQLECEKRDRCLQGLVTNLFNLMPGIKDNTNTVICGPPIMYKFVVRELRERGVPPDKIYMTLERRMRCGVGKCGHCIVGSGKDIRYVCKDGPVFTYWDAMNTKGMI